MFRSFSQNNKSIATKKFCLLSILLFSLVLLSSGCSIFDCTSCVMAGIIFGGICYVLFGWIPYVGPILVILAVYFAVQESSTKNIINESCGTGCSICSTTAGANRTIKQWLIWQNTKRPRQSEPLFIKGQRSMSKGQKQGQKTKFKKKKHKIQS